MSGSKPDTRPRIMCAPDVFERVRTSVERAGLAAAYNVQRSVFVKAGQVYLTAAASTMQAAGPVRHLTVGELLADIRPNGKA